MQMVMTARLIAEFDRGHADLGQQVRAFREVVVADDHRVVGSERLVNRRDPAPGGRLVDQVVMHERCRVNELDAHREVVNVV